MSGDSLERAVREKEVQAARDWYDAKYKDDFTRDRLDAQRKEIVARLRDMRDDWFNTLDPKKAVLQINDYIKELLADAIEGGKD
jgi:hypothetical protein